MRRFYVEPENLDSEIVVLTGDEFHHLKNVSRLEEGEFIELLDGAGQIAKAVIVKIHKKEAELRVLEKRSLPKLPAPHIEIILCVPRFQIMDVIIQKCVELGASSITPVVSRRSFVKTLSKDLLGKIPRWQKIAIEACKQSGRVWPLDLRPPTFLDEAIKLSRDKAAIFLYEGETVADIKSALSSIAGTPESIAVFVGSEGGFSPQEVETFEKLDVKSVTLGPQVLRVETACIAILSVIEYHFGLMR